MYPKCTHSQVLMFKHGFYILFFVTLDLSTCMPRLKGKNSKKIAEQ